METMPARSRSLEGRPWRAELPLRGAGGEPVDLWRTITSHGVAFLPPAAVDEEERVLRVTVPVDGGARTVRVRSAGGVAEVTGRGSARERDVSQARVAHILRLDEDLSGFYAAAEGDPALSWAVAGAGRLARSATVFEDVVKTVCTTNCAWSATERMVGALVSRLGTAAPGAPAEGVDGRAFPTPAAMADADERFYRDEVRAGYRGPYLRTLAATVAAGELDLEELGSAPRDALSDEEVEQRLLTLPGVGPYAAAHIMMMLGRYSRLILDSWTRPTYARLAGRRAVADATIVRRFARYGPYAGLAFWLVLTRDWVDG